MWKPIALAAMSVPLAVGATIIGSPDASFYTWKWTGQTGRLNNNGTPYFDLPSEQGTSCNAAFYMTGKSIGSTCSPGMQPDGIDRIGANSQAPRVETNFWSKGNSTTPDPNVYLSQKTATFVITLMAEGSANNAQNSFGAYYVDPATNAIVRLLLFDGAAGPGTTVRFTPGEYDFGFYIDDGTRTYYTQSRYNSVNATGAGIDTSTTHFALFRDPGDSYNNSNTANWDRMWIAASGGTETTRDFNDMIAIVTLDRTAPPSSVAMVYAPDPGTLAMAGSGTLLILVSLLKRRRARL